MTAHYSIPGSPPCRCAWCRSQQPHPLWAREEIVLGDDHPIRIANRQQSPLPVGSPLRILRLVDRWLAEDAAEELADWLKQDVH